MNNNQLWQVKNLLIAAIKKSDIKKIEELLDNHANEKNISEFIMALAFAAQEGNLEAVQCLLSNNLVIQKAAIINNLPLMYAVNKEQYKVIDCLLQIQSVQKGALTRGVSPFRIAVDKKNIDIIYKFLEFDIIREKAKLLIQAGDNLFKSLDNVQQAELLENLQLDFIDDVKNKCGM